ncbi:MAG TPA: methyl-accepting chemotaxis protein [Candidatus Omnitrophica bacterium]|nr:methyl-accepting chemotaxis protein [Candidatus Omnitrophota bacterium]
MTGHKRGFRRRVYIIKKGLQFRYIGIVFALAFLASMVTGYTVFATGWTLLGEKLANVYPQGRLVYVFRATNIALIRNLLFVSPFIFILGLLFSHKIAGPVYRIEKTIYDMSKGNLTLRIRLRKGDELWDLADIINAMTEKLDNSLESNKTAVLKIKRDLDELKNVSQAPGFDLKAMESSVNHIQSQIQELISSMNKWETTP